MNKTNSSPYSISEFPNGFLITGKDREPVEVILQPTHFQVKLLNSDFILEYGFYDYYRFSQIIPYGLMVNWKAPEKFPKDTSGSPKWSGVYEWSFFQTANALGKRLHYQWKRLLSQVDPRILAVHKSIFSSTYSYGEFERIPQLYDHKFIVKDIINYRAAAIAARNVWELKGADLEYEFYTYDQIKSKLQPHTLGEAGYSMLIDHSRKISNPNHNEIIEAMHEWQDLFSITGQKYPSLSRTLMNLPGGVPDRLVCELRNLSLTRPVTDRLELLLLLLFNKKGGQDHFNLDVIHKATRDRIKRAMQILSTHKNITYSSRRTADIGGFAQWLVDYPYRHRGNVVGLIERSIDWHRNQNEVEITNQVRKLGLETQCSIPPIPLPDVEGVDFLRKVEDIGEEAIKMENCVASYARKAVNGHCYLFHITYQGEEATVELNPQGEVTQALGPRNSRNFAAKWGFRILGLWGKDFPEARSISSTCAGADIFDEGEEIPF